mmetsp:Transcript_2170/g.5364  ORF Transcript_2170/g.5364 Transcript_2170/m.5364 type:complete len:233 (-) Transcript_2170:73-771(-)
MTCKMHDAKLEFRKAIRSEQSWGVSILGHYLCHKGHVTSAGADALFVECVENTSVPSRYQIQNVGICFVGNILRQTFSGVLLNHTLKKVAGKHVLKPFIGIIDAQLLKSIRLKRLESKNVQHPNEPIAIVILLAGSTTFSRVATRIIGMDCRRGRIDLAHQPQKDSRVELLGIGIAPFLGLLRRQGCFNFRHTGRDGFGGKGFGQALLIVDIHNRGQLNKLSLLSHFLKVGD